jgi:Rrf2 family protein
MVYALRACAVLAPAYPGRRLKAAEIARQGKVPVQFLSRILGELRDADLVDARRGYCGGYVLRRDPRDITVAELAQAVDGDGLFVPVPRHRRNPPLAFVDDLQIRLRDVARSAFEETSIADIKLGPATRATGA